MAYKAKLWYNILSLACNIVTFSTSLYLILTVSNSRYSENVVIYAHAGVGHGVEPLIQEQQVYLLRFITSWTCDYAHSTLATVRLFQTRNDQKIGQLPYL